MVVRNMQVMGCSGEDVERVMRYLQDGGAFDSIPNLIRDARLPRPRPWVVPRAIYPRQRRVLEWYAQPHTVFKGLLLAWPVGKGKTVGSICAYLGALEQHPDLRLVVACPKSVVSMWRSELYTAERLYGLHVPDNWEVHTHAYLAKHMYPRRDEMGSIFLVVDEADTFRTNISKNMVASAATLEEERRGIEHVGGGPKPNGAFKMLRLALRCPAVVLVTASERRNSLADLNNLIAVLTRRSEPYPKPQWNAMMQDPQILSCVYRLNESNDPHYPRVRREHDWTPLEGPTLMHYLQVMSLFKPEEYLRPEIFLTGLRCAQQEHLDSLGGGMERVVQHVKGLVARGEKAMICTQFTQKVLRVLSALLQSVPHVLLDGTLTGRERTSRINTFNQPGLETPVALVSTAAGVGVNFNKSRCRNVVIYGSSWNEEVDTQWIGRVRRMHSLDHLPVEEREIKVVYVYMKMPEHVEAYEEVLNRVHQEHPQHAAALRHWTLQEARSEVSESVREGARRLLGEETAEAYQVAGVVTALWQKDLKSADEMMFKIQEDKATLMQRARAREADIVMTFDPK